MRNQILIMEYLAFSEKFGDYTIQFVKPAAAKVELCSFTNAPLTSLWLTTRAYKGIYDTHGDDLGYSPQMAIEDIQKTKLQTPLEMIHMLWLLKDVTRAFTHQLVRYRVGTAFVQESMRFLGMKKVFKVLATHSAVDRTDAPLDVSYANLSNFELYASGAIAAIRAYVDLLDRDVPSEDARGVLPTNILTNIYFDCSLRTLQGIFPQRLCCQAQQGEWQPILTEMRKQIRERMGDGVESLLRAPYEKGESCGYRASFDRPCIWQREKQNV